MSTERMTFRGGWWADVRSAWSYGADSRIAGAFVYSDDSETFEKAARVLLVESVAAAHLPDVDGNALDFGPDIWDSVDGRIGRRIFRRCQELWAEWQKDADPNDTGGTSPASPPA